MQPKKLDAVYCQNRAAIVWAKGHRFHSDAVDANLPHTVFRDKNTSLRYVKKFRLLCTSYDTFLNRTTTKNT